MPQLLPVEEALGAVIRAVGGRVCVRLASGQGSPVLSALAAAEALAVVPESGEALPAGAPVEPSWLDRP